MTREEIELMKQMQETHKLVFVEDENGNVKIEIVEGDKEDGNQ